MTKQKTLLLIPLTIIAGFLLYSWGTFLFTEVVATWRHYLALGLFAILVFLYFKSFKKTVVATGLYLIIGTCNFLTLTPSVRWDSYGLKVVSVEISTPRFQLLSFGLLTLFCILNFDILVDMYLDYNERKKAKRNI
ncbi:MAG: hypothetical protein ABIN67_17965 [Ferruginibacter sp.]